MAPIFWVLISVTILLIVVALTAAMFIIRKRKGVELKGTDYRAFFYIGIAYLILGIALSFVFPQEVDFLNFFVFLGIIFTAMGLGNIDKWRKR